MDSTEYFVAVYTNKVKEYCDEEFFKYFSQFTIGGIVDNTQSLDYKEKLKKLTKLPVYHLSIPYNPKHTLFKRNVATSVEFLRGLFLKTDCKYFLILESDVIIPNLDFLKIINERVKNLEILHKNWGALGIPYYEGFHDFTKQGLQKTHHVLSGATIYRKEAIEKNKFRWDINNLRAFPDALWSFDALKDYSLWDDYSLILEHRHATNSGRGLENL